MADVFSKGGGGPHLSLAGVSDFPGGPDPYHPSGAGPGVTVGVEQNFQRAPAGSAGQGASPTSGLSGRGATQPLTQPSPSGQPNIMDIVRQVGPINMQGNQALGGMPNQGVAPQTMGTLSPLQQQALAMILRL